MTPVRLTLLEISCRGSVIYNNVTDGYFKPYCIKTVCFDVIRLKISVCHIFSARQRLRGKDSGWTDGWIERQRYFDTKLVIIFIQKLNKSCYLLTLFLYTTVM